MHVYPIIFPPGNVSNGLTISKFKETARDHKVISIQHIDAVHTSFRNILGGQSCVYFADIIVNISSTVRF